MLLQFGEFSLYQGSHPWESQGQEGLRTARARGFRTPPLCPSKAETAGQTLLPGSFSIITAHAPNHVAHHR